MEHTVRAEGASPSDVNVEPTQTGVETSRRVPAMVVHHVEHDDEPSCSFVRVVTDVQFASSGREGEVAAKEGGMCKKEETGRQEEKKKIESCGSSGVSQSAREVGESLKSPQFCSRHSACSAPTRLQMHDSDGESSDDEGGELVKILPQIPTMREYPSRAYDGAGPSSVCNPTIDEEGQDEARALPEEFYRPHRAERTPLPETFREINSIWGPEAEREQLLKRFMGNPAEYAYNLALKRSEFWRNFANSVVTVNDVSIRQSLTFRKRVEIKPTRAHIPTDPSKHIYFLVRVYRPNKELNIDEMIPANMSSEFLIRGDLSLCALRDNILCLSDFTSYRDESATPFFTNPSRTQIEYPSAYFFINNVFYNDMRAPNSTDLSYEARTVFEQKGLGTYSFQTMERTRLIDLPLTLGRPAIYMHQACCKHLFTFIAVRRATSEDRTVVSGSSMRYLAEKCVVCTMNEAGWIVTGCRRLPYDPALVCLPCYFYYFYGSNAVKKTEFRAFRYRASELEPTNALYFLEDFESSSESSFAEEAPPPAPLSRIASVFSSLSSLSDIEDDVSKGIIDFIDNVLASREDLSSDEPSAPNSDQLNKTVRARVLDYFFDQCAYGNETDTDSAGDDLNGIYAGNGPNRVEGVLNRVVGEINPVDRDMHDVNHEVNGIYGHAHGGDGQMNDVDGHANDRDDRVNDVDRHANGDDGHANDEGGRANGEGDRANGDGGRANGDGGRANGDRRRENGEGGRANDEGRRVNGEGGRANGEGVRANDDGGRVNGERGRVNGEGGPANGEGRRANDGGGRAHMEGGPANGLVRRALGGDRDANAADREGNAIDREVNGGAGYVNGIYVEDNVVDEDVNGIDGDVNEVNEMDVGNDAEQDVEEADDVEMENENIQVRGQIRINGYGGNAFNIDFDGADISGWHIDEVDIDGRQSDGGDGDDRLDDNRRHNDRDYEDWSGHGFNDRGWTEYGWNDRGWNFDDESVDGDGMEGISGDGDDGDDDDDDDDDNDDDNDGEEDDDDEEDEDNGDEDDEDPHEGTVERMIEDVNCYTDDDSDREGGDVWIFNTLMSENAARVNGFADSDTEDYSTDSDVYYI